MPIINGTMYAETGPMLHNFSELNILLLGDVNTDLKEFSVQINTLHHYLMDAVGSDIVIKLHCTGNVINDLAQSYNITKHNVDLSTKEELLSTVNDLDIDIIFDQNDQFEQKFLWSKFYEFDSVKTLEKLKESVENYLVGSGIAWSFTNPFWNMPLFMKYMNTPGIGMDYFAFMGECTSTKGYTNIQQERVRYITNKIKQVEYARDVLQYYIKRMRKARRNGMADDNYNIQLNYHLSNYYFLMAGTLDSLARLINDVYRLNLTRYSDLAVEKSNFIDANRKKRTGLVRLFKTKKFVEWVSFLKVRRHFIAHEGDMRQTNIAVAKEVSLTDVEIDAIVDRKMDWSLLADVLPADLLQTQREQAVQMIRIQNNYEVIVENIMVIPTKDEGYKKYCPLIGIDHDYEQFSEIMLKVLARLRK